MMFAAPPDQQLEWSDAGVEGSFRFLKRVWNFAYDLQVELSPIGGLTSVMELDASLLDRPQADLRRIIHLSFKQAAFDMGRHQFNTVVSAAMKILNTLESGELAVRVSFDSEAAKQKALTARNMIYKEGLSILLRLLSPITPHTSQTLWKELGYGDNILHAPWPEVDEAALVQDEIELVIQVNGKLRGNLRVSKDADKATIEQLALAHEAVQKQLAGGAAKKVIVVPGRLINVVI
jgi:leucyl-tRNA synthetase